MKEFQGKVAVVTGAASGIGRALAEKCVREGMKVVLADIEEQALTRACQELDPTGTNVLAVQTDVSKAGEVAELAKKNTGEIWSSTSPVQQCWCRSRHDSLGKYSGRLGMDDGSQPLGRYSRCAHICSAYAETKQ